MGPFSQILVRALGESATAGIEYAQRQREGASPAPRQKQKRRRKAKCEPCAALREVDRARDRVAQGKL